MKSKFKNKNCKYWGIKRKLLAINIAQELVVIGGIILAFATDLERLDIFCLCSIPFFLLYYAEQYYKGRNEE